MNNKTFRESCYTCKYANLSRVGDITIGDCHVSKLYPGFYPNQAKSTVLINTKVGIEKWKQFKGNFDYHPLNLVEECKINEQLNHPATRPAERDFIYKEVASMTSSEFRLKYGRYDNPIKEFVLRLVDFLPLKK